MEEAKAVEMISSLNFEEEAKLPEEQRKEKQQEFKNSLALNRATISSLKEELKLTRMNPNGSSFFEWAPNKGMNRRQARAFKRMRNA